jgi:hypothetical protein
VPEGGCGGRGSPLLRAGPPERLDRTSHMTESEVPEAQSTRTGSTWSSSPNLEGQSRNPSSSSWIHSNVGVWRNSVSNLTNVRHAASWSSTTSSAGRNAANKQAREREAE